jgi:hypothetical protein
MKVVLDPPTGSLCHQVRSVLALLVHQYWYTSTNTDSLCHQRLKLIEAKFQMYKLLNQDKETAITRINPHRDFYNVRKVLVAKGFMH